MPAFVVRVCVICFSIEEARCARCGGPACPHCDKCWGCLRPVCHACNEPGVPAFSFPGDRYRHPHAEVAVGCMPIRSLRLNV